MRLRDRNKFPPGGFRFYVPETRWSISPWISFDTAVSQIILHRQGNPYLTQSKGWSLDPAVVADELDQFNANVCQQMGWKDFIGEGGAASPDPKSQSRPSLFSRVGQVAAGIRTNAHWEIAGGNVVDRALANTRARNCATCVKNEQGDLMDFFVEQAARLIRLQLETKNNMKLYTDQDPLLGVCSACGCPLKLKVWAPLDIALKELKPEDKSNLASNCWLLHEK